MRGEREREAHLDSVDEVLALLHLARGRRRHPEHGLRALERLLEPLDVVQARLHDREPPGVDLGLVPGDERLRLVAGRVAREGAHGVRGRREDGGDGAGALRAGRADDGDGAGRHGGAVVRERGE